MNEKKPTIYDLAEALNISVGTVYRALHDTGRISPKTKARVLAKASEMNFKFNQSAQGLSRTPITIGVILCCPVVPFLDEIHSGILYEFSSLSQYNVFSDIRTMPSMNTENCANQVTQCLDEFRQKNYAGVILFLSGSHHVCDDALTALEEASIPMVCIINDIPRKNRVSFVSADGYCAGRIAAELLSLTCSKQRIAILTGDSSVHIHQQNISGFMKEAESGLFEAADIYEHHDHPELVRQELQTIFSHKPAYQGLYITSASSITACPILMNINHDNQVRVVTTDLFAQMKAPLDSGVIFATIFQNPFMQGRKAVKSIYQHLQNKKTKDVVKIPPQIVMRTNIDSFYINESSGHNTDPI